MPSKQLSDRSAHNPRLNRCVADSARVVQLSANWTAPAATTAPGMTATLQPLRVDAAAGFPATGPASARFTAVRTDTATVAAHTDFRCLHAMPRCALPQQFFSVAVRVLAPANHGGGPLPKPAVS